MKPATLNSLTIAKLLSILWLSALAVSGAAQELIFESAELGPTNQYNRGVIIGPTQYFGARFHLSHDTLITGVGGHVWAENFTWAGVFEAYIVRLPNRMANPKGHPFTEDELVASVVCEPTQLVSRDYIFPLSAELPAGHYALVFGGGPGNARLAENEEGVHHPSYLYWNPEGWVDVNHGWRDGHRGSLPHYRLTLYGVALR